MRHTQGMSLEDDLVAAIAADPDDVGAQLVTADWLLELGDARGELIILDHRERTTPGGMIDPALIDRLLLLAAQYGFPCAHPPGPVMLSFSGGGSNPVRYAAYLAGRSYHIHYHYFRLSISIDTIGPMVGYPVRFVRDLETAEPGAWTDEEKLVILTLLSEAIRADTPLPDLCFPYSGVRLPVHEDAPLRAYALPVEFTAPRGLAAHQYGLAVRDHQRWHVLWRRLREGSPRIV